MTSNDASRKMDRLQAFLSSGRCRNIPSKTSTDPGPAFDQSTGRGESVNWNALDDRRSTMDFIRFLANAETGP